MPRELARAKINLNLHVGRVIEDPADPHHGYHPLSSLVVFADYGDELSCEVADETSLEISGSFSKGLETDSDNLVLRAYDKVAEYGDLPGLKFHLIKNLPIASGIGGGSADAAAALRLLQNYVTLGDDDWHAIALSLGADVPVCLYSKTCIMSGIGQEIALLPDFGMVSAILVNPGAIVSTAKIFEAFDARNRGADLSQTKGDLRTMASTGRNDLQEIAISQCSKIATCLNELKAYDGVDIIRMSGSGATCFVLTDNGEAAKVIAMNLAKKFPDWWVQAVTLGDMS